MSEQGYKVTLTNWRGWLGAPDITGDESAQLLDVLTKTRDSAAWKDALDRNKWTDVWQTGEEFAEFIKEDSSRVEKLLKELGL
jgi:putative tricarboxylic transport membrane protein